MSKLKGSVGSFDDFEERADHLSESDLKNNTATSDFFNNVHKALTSKGIKLISGPRGSGKTHLMRYTWVRCKDSPEKPLCLYVSFNKYLRLEPFLQTKSNAIELFHVWVLARVLLSVIDLIKIKSPEDSETIIKEVVKIDPEDIEIGISQLERGLASDLQLGGIVSIAQVSKVIKAAAEHYDRKRSVVLFDDAALTLTPVYMHELFDIIRTIKCNTISPKASVYPGTTEYGPRFHVQHEAENVPVWLSVTDENYSEVMKEIALSKDVNLDAISADINELLKYASFGIPRAYLVMLREFKQGDFKTSQQGFNKIVQRHNKWRIAEYRSLSMKVPKFQALIDLGETLLNKIISELKAENSKKSVVQLEVGFSNLSDPLEERMIDLLVEAGLLYEHFSVSHGLDREYRRYTPHFSLLLQNKAFSTHNKNPAFADIVARLNGRRAKHPIRRTLSKFLSQDMTNLKLNSPPCSQCDAPRLNETQKFCHNCGSALVDESTFERCMSIKLTDVPHLTAWQREKMSGSAPKTIGAMLSLQDPGTELRKIDRIGTARAKTIMDRIHDYVDEFLS